MTKHGAERKSKMATEDYATSGYYYAIHLEELFLYSKVGTWLAWGHTRQYSDINYDVFSSRNCIAYTSCIPACIVVYLTFQYLVEMSPFY